MTTVSLSLHVPTRVAGGDLTPPPGVAVKKQKQIFYFDAEGFSDLNIIIEIARGVALPILAAWLYDRFLKKEPQTKEREVVIREVRYRIESKDQLVQILEREVKLTEKE